MIKVFLKPGKDEPIRRFHPWVFSGAIARTEGQAADGALAEVYDRSGQLLGVGHFHQGSIAVRLLQFGPADLQQVSFWADRFQQALLARAAVGLGTDSATNCYRLVHGEGDGLSGLIVDVYGTVAVMQCHSIGMHRQRTLIADALYAALGERLTAVYDKSAETLPAKYAESQHNDYILPATRAVPDIEGGVIVAENGVRFKVDWETGQKTGFFLDQRDNRALLANLSAGKTVLNTFCYTGGFSAYALQTGATLVHSVDSSAKAMLLTDENAALNAPEPGRHEGFTADVLQFFRQSTRLYDIVVVDPPAYAKTLDKRHNAVQGYKRLNEAAFQRIAPGGLMFTFSCSQVVDRDLFYHTIAAAAMEVGRPVRVLHHLSQGADHPVSLFHPEGAYLKGLVLYVE
jgi:23S rRNA (cytosine1962-C5)-methyltransferase